MKRTLALLVVFAMAMTILPSTVAAPARRYDGQTMSVYVGISPKVQEDIMAYIAPRLKEKYGVTLAVELMGSTAMVERLLVQRERPRISVAGWDQPVALQACTMGLCADIDPAQVSNYKDTYEWASLKVNGKLQGLATSLLAVGLLYNRDEFARRNLRPPTSWNDLGREDLAGRVSITAPESTWGLASLVMFSRVDGGGEDNVNPGFTKIRSFLPKIHTIHTFSSELSKLLLLNEVWMATTGSNMEPALRAQGFPASWVAPVEGAPVVGGGMSIVARGPLQDVAHEYVNLYFSPEFQLLRARNGGATPTNRVAYGRLSIAEKTALPVRPLGKIVHLNWGTIMKSREAWIERWHRDIRK